MFYARGKWHRPRIEDLRDLSPGDKSKRKKSSTNPKDLRDCKPGLQSKRVGKTKPDRKTRYRERLKDADQLRCYHVYMRDSDVIKLLHEVKLEGSEVHSITPRELRDVFDRQWSELTGRVIALAALLAIRK